MYFTTHLAVGSMAGGLLSRAAAGGGPALPMYAFLLGLASHAVLDMIPHQDYSRPLPALADFLASVLFFATAVLPGTDPAITWGGLGGLLPDVEVVLYHAGLIPLTIYPSHSGLLPHPKGRFLSSLLLQGILVLLSLGVLLPVMGAG